MEHLYGTKGERIARQAYARQYYPICTTISDDRGAAIRLC
jgi:hypothetical protein